MSDPLIRNYIGNNLKKLKILKKNGKKDKIGPDETSSWLR